VVAGLRKEDADMLSTAASAVRIVSTPGRDYDFIGWNNIDPGLFGSSDGKTIRPHRLFGNRNVRRALTMAINRAEMVRAYLGQHGQEAIGGVSPLFTWAFNDTLKPLPFDREEAKRLLDGEGWRDADGDGTRERRGIRFAFALTLASGNQLRNVIAAGIQQQLKEVGIEMEIKQVERGTFWEEVTARKYDAWLAGFSVPLQLQLDDLWGSDLQKYPFNLTGFRNARVDQILASARSLADETDGAGLWKEFQAIVHDEQPCTFLFWINNIVGVNQRVKGTTVGVLGTSHRAWEWHVGEGEAKVVAYVR
jgi:peptide/nickel transport system substrate-binding protein